MIEAVSAALIRPLPWS